MKTIRVRMFRRNPSKTRRRKVARKRVHTRWKKVRSHKRRTNPFRVRRTAKRVRSRRVNPARSRKRSTRRRNPALSLRGALNKNTLMRALGLGVGFLGGLQVVSLVGTGSAFGRSIFTPPAFIASIRPGLGLVPVIVGGIIATKARKAIAKDIGLGIVAAGSVDVIRQVLTIASPATAASVGLYVNEGMPSRAPIGLTPPRTGLIVTRSGVPRAGRVGPAYSIPRSGLQLAGADGSSFDANDSSFG